jgi:hypothetical protein
VGRTGTGIPQSAGSCHGWRALRSSCELLSRLIRLRDQNRVGGYYHSSYIVCNDNQDGLKQLSGEGLLDSIQGMLLQTASRRSRVALCATRLQLPLSPARSPIRCSPWRLDSKAASSSIWRGCHRSTITTMPTLDPDWSWGDGANSSSWTAPPSEDWKTWDPEHADKPYVPPAPGLNQF